MNAKALNATLEATGTAMRIRLQACGVALVLLGLVGYEAGPAAAQVLPGVPGASSEPAPESEPQTESDQLRAELEALLQRLEDPKATRELADSVRALLHAMDADPGADQPEAPPGESEVREALTRAKPAAAELLARIEEDLRSRVDTVREAGAQVYEATKTLPGFLAWARRLVDAPAERQAFARAAGGIVAILGAGLLAMWLAARALAPARRALVFRDQDRLLSRWIMAILLILLRIVPILVFAVAVNLLILILRPEPMIQIWLSAGVSAIVVVRLGVVLAEAVLSPAAAQARMVPLSEEAARLLMTYVHWLLALGVYGYTLISVLRWHGLPSVLQITLDRLVALALVLSACWMVIRRRRAVAAAIARLADGVDVSSIPWHGVASVWHIFALIFLWALFVIYIIEGLPLFIEVLMTSVLSLSVLIGLVVALRYVERRAGALQPSLSDDDDLDEELGDPETEETAKPSSPRRAGPLVIVLRIAIVLVAILTFLQVWGLDTWLLATQSGPGQRLILILVVVGLIYLLWLGFNHVIAGYMRRLETQPGTARSSTRTRTALVVARNAAFITLCAIGGMVILSEIGLNIGPLLAGAGVIGIAIGFGAQHLVQDIITGLFNLIEDTFAVGDVVDLGGKAGVVEAVTIRTVRLRDLGGNVHTIPFSAIAVVTNMTKDFSFAAFSIGVAYRESVDQVMQVIKDVAEDLRRDRAYRRVILEPMEMLGLDAFADSAVVIKCRLRVRPGSQWTIGREFNRRLKNRFDELGIEIPFPHQTIYFGQDRSGAAPPAHVVMDTAAGRSDAQAAEAPARPARPHLAD